MPFIDTTKQFAQELPFVTNSVVKTFALAALCVYAARRELALAGPVAAVHVLSVVVSALYLIFLDTSYSLPLLGGTLSMTTTLWIALALDGTIAVAVTLVSLAALAQALRPAFPAADRVPLDHRVRRGAGGGRARGADRAGRRRQRREVPREDPRAPALAVSRRAVRDRADAAAHAAPAAVDPRAGRAARLPRPPLPEPAGVAAVPQARDHDHDPHLPAAELRGLLQRPALLAVDRIHAVQRTPAREADPGTWPAPAARHAQRRRRRDRAGHRRLHHRQRRGRRHPRLRARQGRSQRARSSSAARTSSRASSPRTRSA